jgi:hypothetical protein
MKLFLRAGHVVLCAVIGGLTSPACYSAGNGTPPPLDSFYYPTGLAVSSGGNVLYAINSDFDLQWNGGTLQSYDLYKVRQDAAALVQANLTGATTPPAGVPFVDPWFPDCLSHPPPPDVEGLGVQLIQGCAPPVDSTQYVRDSAVLGAFAEDLQLSKGRNGNTQLLFAPISGNATLTWAKITADDPASSPVEGGANVPFPAFTIDCPTSSERVNNRCDSNHEVGNSSSSPANTRNVTLPGNPYGMAQSEDGSVIAVTDQANGATSLLTTGFGEFNSIADYPTMQYVLWGMPTGGQGITAVPHDRYGPKPRCEDVADRAGCLRPAFMQTSRYTPEVDLDRYYDQDGSSVTRPYLAKERPPTINSNLGGSDFRGIVIDPTPRIACEASATSMAARFACGRLPARLFIASRTPPGIVYGQVGQLNGDGSYDPDAMVIQGNIANLPPGPSKMYLASVVMPDSQGIARLHLRLFVVLYDSSSVAVVDPTQTPPSVEKIITTGAGPNAMAFDPFCFSARCATPFSLDDVATNAVVPADSRQPASLGLRRYRFAYVGIFRHSYVQAIDLDQLVSSAHTFETVVFNLGIPQIPKGQSQ